jgi:DNA-binding transcriptional LysR family regulator
VFEELHFGRAAERLHLAQPPLSQAIRKLERELGVQLLDRTSRVVTPTETGRVFAEEARKVLTSFEAAIAEARQASAGRDAALAIGCVPHLPLAVVRRFLGELREREPTIDPEVTHLLSLELIRRVREGTLDFAIVHRAEYSGVEMEEIAVGEPLVAVLPLDHQAAAREVVRPTDLGDDILVTAPRSINPAVYDRGLASVMAAGYRFRSIREASGMSARDLVLAVADGFGIGLVSASVHIAGGDGTVVVRRPLDPAPRLPETVVAWRADPPPRLRALLVSIREIAGEMRRSARRDEG